MTVKAYAAIMTGALSMVVTALILWIGTQLPIEDVIAVSLVAYMVGIVGAYFTIDRLERRKLRRHAAQIVMLVQEEMNRRKEEAS